MSTKTTKTRPVLDDENVRKAWEKAGGLAINHMDTDILDALPELVYEWFD